MGDNSNIEWCDASWNVITGCSVVSPGCTNCYAMRQAGTRLRRTPSYEGLTEDSKAGPVWNGRVRFNEKQLRLPMQWSKPRRIFVNSMGDLFHENVPDAWIDKVFWTMAAAHHHVFQVLTKRPERMQAYCSGLLKRPIGIGDRPLPLPNVWLGISAEDQRRADERIPPLLATPAAVRWVSAEPLLGPIDFTRLRGNFGSGEDTHVDMVIDALKGKGAAAWNGRASIPDRPLCPKLDWLVVGGESGPNARPMNPEWARSIRDQCAAAGVPFHFKQWGEWLPEDEAYDRSLPCVADGPQPSGMYRVGKHAAGRTLDGVIHDGYPA